MPAITMAPAASFHGGRLSPSSSADEPIPDYRAALTGDIRGLRVGVLRHVWEEDLPAHEEVRAAMEPFLGDLDCTVERVSYLPRFGLDPLRDAKHRFV